MGAWATVSPAGASDITGSGTAGQIAVFTAEQAIGNPVRAFTSTPTGFVIGSATEEPPAILSLVSNTQGFSPPRMTTTERNAIISPSAGLLVFNTTVSTISAYTGSNWVNVITTTQIPVTYAVGDLLYADTTSTLARLADVVVGSYLRSGGDATAPLWSTLKLPNSATVNRVVYATATNTWADSSKLTFDGHQMLVGGRAALNSTDVVNFYRTQNASTSIWAINATNGTAGQAGTFVSADDGSTSCSMRMLSSNFTTSGPLIGGSCAFVTNSTIGMQIGTISNTGILLWTNNTNIGRFTSTGRFGMGVDPTAVIHMKAGTATASTAPLKFTSGTNLTTAEAGAMEYNGTNLFFTRSGTTRQTVLTANVITTEALVSDTSITINIAGTDYKLLARA